MKTRGKFRKSVSLLLAAMMCAVMMITGCGDTESNLTANNKSATTEQKVDAPKVADLKFKSAMKLSYAKCFNVFYYNDGYKLIEINHDRQYLLVPEGKEAPKGIDSKIIILKQPLNKIYLAATSAMSLFDSIDSMNDIALTGTDVNGWNIEAPKEALKSGSMTYSGKYNQPDYEMMVNKGCDLAIESTMILHAPEVQEMIEDLGIPVLIDYASYETEPLGRSEWIKLYGALLNKEDQADKFFEKQASVIKEQSKYQKTKKTVAYFTVSSNGNISIRKSKDYITKLIELGGGNNVFQDVKEPAGNSTSVDLSMEEFYNTAVDADYLIYNATIEDKLDSIDDLIEKDDLFQEFKAVKEGNVWQVDKKMYQSTGTVGQFIRDVHHMLTDQDESKMTFMSKVK